jgi:eukaryotic-like serine/threonine-protein kinase
VLGGRYRVLRHLGSGGMASVLLCQDERLDRQVAVKRLHADSPADVERRFVREAKVGASLNHPNLVSVFDTATDDEGVLIVMEYVEGEALARTLRRGPLEPERVAAMVRDLGDALDHAHAQGVVHRDVKPGNVLLRHDGVTKLVDLGIATASDQTRITHSGTVLGTAAYMAPEQLEGGETTAATDVYALGIVAYEALTGERARAGRTPVEIAHRIATSPPPDLREALPGASPAAAQVLKRAMARDPGERPRSAGELARQLAGALEEPPTAATRRLPRSGKAAAAAGGAAAGAGAAAAAASRGREHEPATRPRPAPRRPRESEPVAPPRPAAAPPARARPPARGARPAGGRPVGAIALALVFLALAAAVVIGAILASGGDGDGGEPQRADGGQQAEQGGAQGERRRPEQQEQQAQPAEPAPSEPAPSEPAPAEPEEPAQEQQEAGGTARGIELNNQGFALMGQGDYAGAVPILQQAVASWPEDSRDINYAYALFNLGKSLNRSGNPEAAIPYLEQRLTWADQQETVQAELDLAKRNAGQD